MPLEGGEGGVDATARSLQRIGTKQAHKLGVSVLRSLQEEIRSTGTSSNAMNSIREIRRVERSWFSEEAFSEFLRGLKEYKHSNLSKREKKESEKFVEKLLRNFDREINGQKEKQVYSLGSEQETHELIERGFVVKNQLGGLEPTEKAGYALAFEEKPTKTMIHAAIKRLLKTHTTVQEGIRFYPTEKGMVLGALKFVDCLDQGLKLKLSERGTELFRILQEMHLITQTPKNYRLTGEGTVELSRLEKESNLSPVEQGVLEFISVTPLFAEQRKRRSERYSGSGGGG